MKKIISVLVLLSLSACSHARFDKKKPVELESGLFGVSAKQDGKRVSPKTLVQGLEEGDASGPHMEGYHSNATLGMVFGGAGGLLIAWPLGTELGGRDPNWTLAYIGAGLVVVSIPFYMAASNRIRKAITAHNKSLGSAQMETKPQFFPIVSADKAGSRYGLAMGLKF